MNYERLTPVLVNAIQEQQAIIENMKKEHKTNYSNLKTEQEEKMIVKTKVKRSV